MSPDLFITVCPAAITDELGLAIERAIARQGEPAAVRATYREGLIHLDGHSALDDRADWTAETWLFTPRGARRVLASVRLVCDLLPAAFAIEAAWAGDSTRRHESLTRAGLLAMIARNRMGNRVRYDVEAGGKS